MNVPDVNRREGYQVDAFLEAKPSLPEVPVALRGFDYLECTDCHCFHDLKTVQNLTQWKFSIMGLRRSILNVAKGVCPGCQEMRRQFRGVIGEQED